MSDNYHGPRRAALETRKVRRRRSALFGSVVVVLLLGSAAAVGLALASREEAPEEPPSGTPGPETGQDRVSTMLLFGTNQDSAEEGAVWMTLLAVNESDGRASVVYIPAHTAAEVPARGLQPVGGALATGGVPLLLLSTENMLGIGIDNYLELSQQDAQVLFQEIGALEVTLSVEVRASAGDKQTRVLFPRGPQRLNPPALADLLYAPSLDGDDLELGNRHLAFWDALLRGFASDPEALGSAIGRAGPALSETDGSLRDTAAFFEQLSSLPIDDVSLSLMPVRPVGVGGAELYAPETDDFAGFLEGTLGADLLIDDQINVQILNGNGYPGIGQEVAEKLVGEGFRVILSGNARTLDYKKTLVIVYDSTEEQLELAERARKLIGVGEVQVAAQRQGIVDLTIVVGKDFLEAR